MLKFDRLTRDLLAEQIRLAVDQTAAQQLRRRAQEPPITSKIASTIELILNNSQINNYRVRVIAQDFTDRGRGSGERLSGADLYIGIEVDPIIDVLPRVAKGLLIQAKKTRSNLFKKGGGLLQSVDAEQAKLVDQCDRMLKRTDNAGAFVWLYHSAGTRVVPAAEVVAQPDVAVELLQDRDVAEHFREVLDCFQGDTNLVGPDIFEDDFALAAFMEEIGVSRGVTIHLEPEVE